MVVHKIQAECVSQIMDGNNLSNHNISNSEQATGVSESKIQGNIDILPVKEEEADNKISDLDLMWDSNDDNNSNKIMDVDEHFKNVSTSQINLCSEGSKLLCQTSNVDLKSSPTSSEEYKIKNEDMDFDNFIWKSEKSNIKENTNGFINKEVQEDDILNCKKRSSLNKNDDGVECLVKKAKLAFNDNSVLTSNQMPLGLVHIPTNISFDDIPSRYPKPIEDALNLTAEERIAFAERRRIDKETQNDENLMAARQGRLHPSNARFNQGPVINPPPICPRSLVTFTPGGQRYEVDLNEGRPTYFRSEYNRMQYDDATVINHRKMMSNVQDGSYLPKTLNDEIERCHIAEQRFVERLVDGFVKNVSENCEREEESPENGKGDKMETDNVENDEDGIIKADNIEVEGVTVKADNIKVESATVKADNIKVESATVKANSIEVEDGSVQANNSEVGNVENGIEGHDNDNLNDPDDGDNDSDSYDTISSSFEDMDEDMAFLDLELILLQFHRDVSVMILDHPLECLRQLRHIISLDLQPLMFKKNPQLVELAKKLMSQTEFPDIQIAATEFYDKIKSLFEVPDGVEFEDYFQFEIIVLRQREINSLLDAVLLTNEDTNPTRPFFLRRWGFQPFVDGVENESTVENNSEIIANEGEEERVYTSEDDEDASLVMLPQYTDDEDDGDDDDDDDDDDDVDDDDDDDNDEEEEEESFQFPGPNEE